MSDQNQSNQNQSQGLDQEDRNPNLKPSVYDEQHGIGENNENHTTGGYIQYEDDGVSSQNSTAGQNGEDVHTNNDGGTSLAASRNIRFKTSMKCAGCVESITPGMNGLTDVQSWNADVSGSEKILSVDADEAAIPKVIAVLEKAGFKAEQIS